MTAKLKAEELVKKMYLVRSNSVSDITHHFAIQCALIAVDEILKELNNMNIYEYTKAESCVGRFLFWQEVKQEIEKL